MALTGFLIGTYVDRYGAKVLMLIGSVIMVFALSLHGYVTELWQWFLLNGVLLTIGGALLGNLVVNVTLAKWFVEKRGQAIAWAAMGVSFAGIVLTPLITVAIDVVGWRSAWSWLAAGVGLIVFPVALVMRRAPEDHGLHPDGKTNEQVSKGHALRSETDFARSLTRRQALRTWSFYFLVFSFGLFSINIVVMLLQTIPYLSDAGFSRNQAAFAIVVASMPAMASKPVWGFFIDRLSAKPLAALGAAITGIALFCIVAAVSYRSLPWVYAAFFLLGLGWGGMIPLQEVIWGSFFGRRYLGAVRSAGLPFALVLGAGAPLAVSYHHDVTGSYDVAFLVVAGLNLLSGIMLQMMPPPRAVNLTPNISQISLTPDATHSSAVEPDGR